MKRNIYSHEIDLRKLHIDNSPREEFRTRLEAVKYLGYEVEQLADGRKIVITKPGGKFVFGKVRREDFMVWVYNASDSSLWLISHKDIFEDLQQKGRANSRETIRIIDALEAVCNGEDPEDVLRAAELANPVGQPPETLLKAYKWIWGQEDCNYPTKQGREMSMSAIRDLRESLSGRSAQTPYTPDLFQSPP